MVFLVLAVIQAGCAETTYRKRSFVGQQGKESNSSPVPDGLSPLGALDKCQPSSDRMAPRPLALVSHPERFTKEASRMIAALGESLSNPPEGLPEVRFLLSEKLIVNTEQAMDLGRRCGALIVLWEQGHAKTLRMTLPQPGQIPLKTLARERLCEFGDHGEQTQILYLTVIGLLAMHQNDYNRAVFYLENANRLDDYCLHIPGSTE